MNFPTNEHQRNGDERFPLPARQSENETDNVHIIDIQNGDNGSASSNHEEHTSSRRIDERTQEEQTSSGSDPPDDHNFEASTSRDNSNQTLRSSLNSRLWIPVELFITICQVTALVVVLSNARNEKIGLPLLVWVVGYGFGCIAAVPILCWHYSNIKRTEQDANMLNNNVSPLLDDNASNVSPTEEDENQQRMISTSTSSQETETSSLRLSRNMSGALDVFFAVWFVLGNICLFGGYASPVDCPQIYKLCLIFIILSYIGYAMPLILCATICCFLPCIVNAIDSQDDQYHTRGASDESINALPTYKFKLKGSDDDQDSDPGQKEKLEALRKDSVCCVCLAEFEDDEEMRELPCSHFFHVECIDTWLKLNATCPLCKFEIGLSRDGESPPTGNTNHTNS